MLLIVLQCFLMTLLRKIIVFKPTLQTTNKFFFCYFDSGMPGPLAIQYTSTTVYKINSPFCYYVTFLPVIKPVKYRVIHEVFPALTEVILR